MEAADRFHEQFVKTLLRTPHLSAPGPLGWRFEHFKIIVGDEPTLQAVATLAQATALGELPSPMLMALQTKTVIPLAKGEDDVRPIGVEDAFLRLAETTVAQRFLADARDLVASRQFGIEQGEVKHYAN